MKLQNKIIVIDWEGVVVFPTPDMDQEWKLIHGIEKVLNWLVEQGAEVHLLHEDFYDLKSVDRALNLLHNAGAGDGLYFADEADTCDLDLYISSKAINFDGIACDLMDKIDQFELWTDRVKDFDQLDQVEDD